MHGSATGSSAGASDGLGLGLGLGDGLWLCEQLGETLNDVLTLGVGPSSLAEGEGLGDSVGLTPGLALGLTDAADSSLRATLSHSFLLLGIGAPLRLGEFQDSVQGASQRHALASLDG